VSATVLQFGTGKFLRAFADLFAHELISSPPLAPTQSATIVAVQSTGSGRVEQLNASGGRYRVAVRGLQNGREVDQIVEVASVRQALAAQIDWPKILDAARSESLAAIVSNTTEAGYALDPVGVARSERSDGRGEPPSSPTTPFAVHSRSDCPRSFPAKLLAVLEARFEAGRSGVNILPCELLEQNGDRLRDLVISQAAQWNVSQSLVLWLQEACVWRNTLVDRIVSAPCSDDPLATRDPLFAVAEPFALWLIEGTQPPPVFGAHPAVQAVEVLQPYYLRKVRILNGAHTALVAKAWPLGFETVRQAALDVDIGRWLERLLFEEIVPTLEGRADRPDEFARQCLERFANPFLEHRLADIALAHDTKLRTRLVPTWHEFRARFGRAPELLGEVLAGIV